MADAEKCPECGEKFGKILGVQAPPQSLISFLKEENDYQDGICITCARARFTAIKNNVQDELDRLKAYVGERLEAMLKKIFVSTSPIPESQQQNAIGIVSGYSVIGTGPIVTFLSSITDFVGSESSGYMQKIKEAESSAINSAKLQALRMGASSIHASSIHVAEATSGHGMIMVSFVGTAVSNTSADNEVVEFIDKFLTLEMVKKRKNKVSGVQLV